VEGGTGVKITQGQTKIATAISEEEGKVNKSDGEIVQRVGNQKSEKRQRSVKKKMQKKGVARGVGTGSKRLCGRGGGIFGDARKGKGPWVIFLTLGGQPSNHQMGSRGEKTVQ